MLEVLINAKRWLEKRADLSSLYKTYNRGTPSQSGVMGNLMILIPHLGVSQRSESHLILTLKLQPDGMTMKIMWIKYFINYAPFTKPSCLSSILCAVATPHMTFN